MISLSAGLTSSLTWSPQLGIHGKSQKLWLFLCASAAGSMDSCETNSRVHHGIDLEKQHWQVRHSDTAKDQQEIKA